MFIVREPEALSPSEHEIGNKKERKSTNFNYKKVMMIVTDNSVNDKGRYVVIDRR